MIFQKRSKERKCLWCLFMLFLKNSNFQFVCKSMQIYCSYVSCIVSSQRILLSLHTMAVKFPQRNFSKFCTALKVIDHFIHWQLLWKWLQWSIFGTSSIDMQIIQLTGKVLHNRWSTQRKLTNRWIIQKERRIHK